jgi:hypothetical protein
VSQDPHVQHIHMSAEDSFPIFLLFLESGTKNPFA